MSVLRNPKHERFAQLVSQGVSKAEAAKTVGYSELRAAAQGCNLAKIRNVAARIDELSARVVDQSVSSAAISKAWVLEQLRDIALEARRAGEYIPANKSLELIGKEFGMFVDRKNISIEKPISEMTNDELVLLVSDGTGSTSQTESIN